MKRTRDVYFLKVDQVENRRFSSEQQSNSWFRQKIITDPSS